MSIDSPVNARAAGLDPARLARIRAHFEKHIARGQMAGAIGLIQRRGHIGYFETFGQADMEAARPMEKDAIFRIYSMTKAVTGVAAMMLFEEGAFALADPLARYLPEFRQMQVAVEEINPDTGRPFSRRTEPATRQITVLDIMRHTSGFNYTGPRDEKGDFVFPQRGIQPFMMGATSAEFIQRLASVPLSREPGTAWDYGMGTDVLGRLVEVLSGQTLNDFFRSRIFGPLGMNETAFHLPASQKHRFAAIYQPQVGGPIQRIEGGEQDRYHTEPMMYAGGAGLVSTVSDYLRFTRMLLNRGQFEGERLLSPLTVDLMHSDLLGDIPVINPLLAPGHGFGVTFAISKGPGATSTYASKGQYRWGGAAGTAFLSIPHRT